MDSNKEIKGECRLLIDTSDIPDSDWKSVMQVYCQLIKISPHQPHKPHWYLL